MELVVYTFFSKQGKPLTTGLYNNGKSTVIPLWMPGTGIKVYDIWRSEYKIIKAIQKCEEQYGVVINDFKSHINSFDFLERHYDVYDPVLPELPIPKSMEEAERLFPKILPKLASVKRKPWQKVYANAAMVYQQLQNRGVLVGMIPEFPQWSTKTYTGRGKCSGFNVQGATDEVQITNPAHPYDDVQLHFDWRAADIRVAALLSGDEKLDEMSMTGDPYMEMVKEIGGVSRDDCKVGLLSAINAMYTDNAILDMFPSLKNWISECNAQLDAGKPLESLLGRSFHPGDKIKRRAPFNATMQGSIAHAMQLTIRRVWDELGDHLLAEIHDSIVVTCRKENARATMEKVVDIMTHPFAGVLESNPVFPLRVSIGTKWKSWKEYKVFC